MSYIYSKKLIIFLIFLLVFTWTSFSLSQSNYLTSTVRISICGNDRIDEGEVCDGTNLAGKACQDFGYTHGELACSPSCDKFITSACYTPPTPPSGGGGGLPPPSVIESRVNLTGRAYPGETVTALKDGQIATQTVSDPGANFSVSVLGLSSGTYVFGVYAQDNQGNKSSMSTFPITVTNGTIVSISNIFLAPTISVDKDNVLLGENLVIFGQSAPEAEIIIQVSSEELLFFNTPADSQGIYLYNFDTSPLSIGSHSTKSRANLNGEASPFSKAVPFQVLTELPPLPPSVCGRADLNCDGRVNLVDFSIAAFWYKRELSPEFRIIEQERLNGDGRIDLVDFSIMAYYWTG